MQELGSHRSLEHYRDKAVGPIVISRTLPESPRYSRVIPKSFPYDPRVIPEYSQVIPEYSRVLSSIPEFPELNPSRSTYLLIPE